MILRNNITKPAGDFVTDLIDEVERRAKEHSKKSSEIAEKKRKQIRDELGF